MGHTQTDGNTASDDADVQILDDEGETPEAGNGGGPEPVALRRDVRYLVLCGVLLVVMVSYTAKAEWGVGLDIWEHAAAVRQLGADPIDPGHPLFHVAEPHQFYSPYHLVLGLVHRLTGLSVDTVLGVAGIANLVLLMAALWLFLTRLTKRRHVPFYALLFLLFLWGPGAWYFSGFLHFKVLPYVLPYPATFAVGLSLLILWVHARFLEREDWRLLGVVAAGFAIVSLVHPVDAVLLALGLIALTAAGAQERLLRNLLQTLGGMAAGLVLALAWPYFSLYELLISGSNAVYRQGVANDDQNMYRNVLISVWPMLVVLPFVVRRLVRGSDPLALWFLATLIVYGYGWVAHEWSVGRLIAGVMLIGAMVLADERVLATQGGGGRVQAAVLWVQVSTVALLAIGIFFTRPGFAALPRGILEELPSGWVPVEVGAARLSNYDFLGRFVDGDVVVTDGFTNLEIPAAGAKVLTVPRPEAFVPMAQRNADLNRFFALDASEPERRSILQRHGASFVLLRNDSIASDVARYGPLKELGPVVYDDGRFTLIDVRPSAGGPLAE